MDNPTADGRLLNPPVELPGFHKNNWFAIPPGDPVVGYMVEKVWDQPEPPLDWEAARLSKAVYLYREKTTHWTVVVKFYTAKFYAADSAKCNAARFAANEFMHILQAEYLSWTNQSIHAPKALACSQGALFLEYIDGLTLENTIAIRCNHPGVLLPALEMTARLLAGLHSQCPQPELACNYQDEIEAASRFTEELALKGALKGNGVAVDALRRLIDHWTRDPVMIDYIPTYIHGSATTLNFISPKNGGIVAISWRHMGTADPASEMGRFFAEVAHSIQQHGGDYTEAEKLLEYTAQAYCQGLPAAWDSEALLHRARFYQASSTLRIARNRWLPPLQRSVLVAQALALLA